MRTRCKSCGARIVWALTDQDKRMPVDAEPSARGNIKLVWIPSLNEYRAVVQKGDVAPALAGSLYLSHFASCAQAQQHRRPR